MSDTEQAKHNLEKAAEEDTNFNLQRAILARELGIPESQIIEFMSELELASGIKPGSRISRSELLKAAQQHFKKHS